jgi:hypothetical protein
MTNEQKFITFLESIKTSESETLIESIKTGFSAIMEFNMTAAIGNPEYDGYHGTTPAAIKAREAREAREEADRRENDRIWRNRGKSGIASIEPTFGSNRGKSGTRDSMSEGYQSMNDEEREEFDNRSLADLSWDERRELRLEHEKRAEEAKAEMLRARGQKQKLRDSGTSRDSMSESSDSKSDEERIHDMEVQIFHLEQARGMTRNKEMDDMYMSQINSLKQKIASYEK